MLFTSLEFVFLFLPVVLIINFLLPKTARNYWLMAASLFFYGWGEPKFLLVMIISILFNYFTAWKLSDLREEGKQRYCRFTLILAIMINLGILFYYKYMNFVTDVLIKYIPATGNFLSKTSHRLPIGISFFTFQAISYIVDVYRGTPAQKNAGKIALYISLFPQLIAGPIVRYNTIADQIDSRQIHTAQVTEGIYRFLRGFNKKVLLANMISIAADASWNNPARTVVMAWFGALCYSLQIFFDFSGYSDMAIGMGKMLGFSFEENFNYPYIARTVSEFWRRWHISLGSWFRDYVYIPLGGSRVNSRWRLVFNISAVWILTGIWHGAAWTFLAWGILYAVIISAEKMFGIETFLKKHCAFSIGYRVLTLIAVLLLWVLFRSENLHAAWYYLKTLLGIAGNEFFNDETFFYLREYRIFVIIGCLASTPVFARLRKCLCERSGIWQEGVDGITGIIQLILFVISVSYLVMNAHNPFIYFNF